MSAATVIIRRRKRAIRRFQEAGATSPAHPIRFADVGMRRSWVFNRMIAQGVFVEAGADRYWMDPQAAESFLQAQRRRALIGAAVLLVLCLIVIIASSR